MQRDNLNICVADNLTLRAGRDRISGILRFAADHPRWHVRILSIGPENPPAEFYGLSARQAGFAAVIGDDQDFSRILRPRWNSSRRIPHVVIDPYMQATPRHRAHVVISVDDAALGERAAEVFARRGLRALAYFGGAHILSPIGDRLHSACRASALQKAAEALGLTVSVCAVHGQLNWAEETERLSQWLLTLPHPCGVLAYNDEHAQMVVNACRLTHLRIPDQIQLIGIDNDIAVCENLRPTLTSIQPDFEGAGFLAAQKLDEMLKNGCPRKTETFLYGVRSIAERASTQDIRGGGRLVGLAREYIRQHATEPITAAQIAKELNVSPRTLERRFCEILHCGVAKTLRDYRLECACALLRETDRTINDISCNVGFDSPNHLKAAFKKAFGMTMSDYRNGLSGQPDFRGSDPCGGLKVVHSPAHGRTQRHSPAVPLGDRIETLRMRLVKSDVANPIHKVVSRRIESD